MSGAASDAHNNGPGRHARVNEKRGLLNFVLEGSVVASSSLSKLGLAIVLIVVGNRNFVV